MRLTRRGITTFVIAAAILVTGRLLGSIELYMIGAGLTVAVVIATLYVALTRIRLDVRRRIHPPRVYAGAPSRVDIEVVNTTRRSTPVLGIHDAVSSTRGARLLMSPLNAGQSVLAAYRLPTERRGIVEIGPLVLRLSDPFGFAAMELQGAGLAELTVLPPIDRVTPPPHTSGDDPLSGAEHPNSLGRTGEDFYALRSYVVGDDLRKVHWPATARHDDLMVRQDELPWQGRCTIFLDTRMHTMPAAALELAVSATASIATAAWQRQDLVRVVTADGFDSGFATGQAQMSAIMEYLATVEASPEPAFRAGLARVSTSAAGGSFVALIAQLPLNEVEALGQLRTRFGWVRLLRFQPSSWDPQARDETPTHGSDVVDITKDRTFVTAWETSVGRRRHAGLWR